MSILFTLDDFTKVEKVTMPWAGETYFIPAGTPMSADGIANDGNAIGILAESARLEYEYDYGTNPYGKVDYTYSVITHGYVNTDDAEASFGGTYSDECRSALSNIVFCDNHKIGGGGASGAMVVNLTYSYDEETDTELVTADKTPSEVYEAMKTSLVIGICNDETIRGGNYPLGCATALIIDGIPTSRFSVTINNEGAEYVLNFTGNIEDNLWYAG